MPGAKLTGQLEYTPIIMQAKDAARHVPTKLAPKSIPLTAIICGFTKMMYAIVTNVVTPAKTSLPIEVLFDSSLNIFSNILVNFTAFKTLI